MKGLHGRNIVPHWLLPTVAIVAAVALAGGCVTGTLIYLKRRARQTMVPVSSTPETTVTTTETPTTTTTTTQVEASISVATTTKKPTVAPTTKRPTTTTKTYPKVVTPTTVAAPSDPLKETVPRPTQPKDDKAMTVERVKKEFEGSKGVIGIDVWRQNADPTPIDWKKVKADGVTFAMIRVGGRFYGKSDGTEATQTAGKIYPDTKFEENIQGALEAGIQVGVYFFSAAVNEQEALEEAQYVLDQLAPYKDKITWPVAYDFEVFGQGRLQGVSATTVTDNAIAFMEYVAKEGYTPMLYSYRNSLWNQFETGRLGRYRIWMAHYVNALSQKNYGGRHAVWQCASDGQVSGIRGNVDLNIAYEDLSKAHEKFLTESDFPVTMEFEPVEDRVVSLANNLGLRLSPNASLPNRYATGKKGEGWKRTGVNAEKGWSRLELADGTTVYASNDYLTVENGETAEKKSDLK